MLRESVDTCFLLMGAMSYRLRGLIREIDALSLDTGTVRTVSYLLREAKKTSPPYVALTLPAPKAVIASMLNMSAETFSRELHRLKDEGLIEIDRRTIYLRNKPALLDMAQGMYLG